MNQPFCSPVQALRSVLDAAALLPSPSPETIPLEAACGRIAAGDLCARMDQPPFDRSPLDGYALHSADTAGASRETPVTLPVVMKLYAGDAPAAALPAGCAARIMTGAPLPEGADCVLMQELTDSGEETVQLYAAVKPLQNVVFRGEDVAAGAVIAPAGTVLTPAHLGVLAGQGYAEVTVCCPLTVGILSTGSELLEVLEASTFCTPEAIGGFPQVSGIEFTVDTSKAYDAGDEYPGTTYAAPKSINRVTITSVGGKDFDPAATYTIATNDFMASGGDTYYRFINATANYDLGIAMDEVVMDYVKTVLGGTITADKYGQPAGRITVS